MSKKSAQAKAPKVTVLMGVYNAQEFLHEAIDSILNQTFTDFEFLIISDGSIDKSVKIIKSYKDPRIRLIERKKNWGLTRTLNQGIELARGEYIARQDADDISVPNRLEKEVKYLFEHPGIGLVGSNYTIMDIKGKPLVTTTVFTHPDDLKVAQVAANQFGHGSIMMRKKLFDRIKPPYDKSVGYVEDYDLWIRISRITGIANFKEPLYFWRKSPDSVSHSNADLQIQQAFTVRDRSFQHFLKHRMQYRLFRYHPSGPNYHSKKSALYRDYSYLYRQSGRPFRALILLGWAILFDRRNRNNYRYVKHILTRRKLEDWTFEFL